MDEGAKRILVSGNEAVAIGALDAGCNFYVGYPITPSSEIMHYMARELPKRGGMFIQAEDELAAINIAIGASWGGARVMTATSGPGFSLMQEGLGYAIMTETPLVLVNVMRVGPATGQASKPAQGDVMQARWGRHGDQAVPVLAPATPQEAYDLTIEAFAISEQLRVPTIVLSDEFVAHGREVVFRREKVEIPERPRPRNGEPPFGSEDPRIAPPMPPLGAGYYVLVTGSTHNEWGYRDVHSFETHFKLTRRLYEKIWGNVGKLFKMEVIEPSKRAKAAIVCFGSVSRSAREARRRLESEGIPTKLIRLITLWPIDSQKLGHELEDVELVVVPELNLGQLRYDVEIAIKRSEAKIVGVNKVGGGIPIYASEIVEAVKKGLGV